MRPGEVWIMTFLVAFSFSWLALALDVPARIVCRVGRHRWVRPLADGSRWCYRCGMYKRGGEL